MNGSNAKTQSAPSSEREEPTAKSPRAPRSEKKDFALCPWRLGGSIALVLCVGCGGHAARTIEARTALDAGSPKTALQLVNAELEVDTSDELPEDVGGDNALLLLDRAMILQELASTASHDSSKRYALSSRDIQIADKQIEILDLSRNAVADIGRYVFSDDAGPYKAPVYEKLMINTMNMLNYLAVSDLNGARVEARRLAVMQRYVAEHEKQGASLMGPGSYIAGFIFEKSGRADEALRYYDEALQQGDYASLHEPVRRLAQRSNYRTTRIQSIVDRAAAAQGEGGATTTETDAPPSEILVVVSFGRVPAKRARRLPIGLALTYASGALSPADHARANRLALQGLVTWVNYPELGSPRGDYDVPGFALDGEWQRIEGALAVDREAKRAWDDAKGAVVASAITRTLARVGAGQVAQHAVDGPLGLLLSLGAQATLTAVDTPDTRSWATLPARIAIGRAIVRPGTHWVDVEARGIRKRQRVTVSPGGWAPVVLTVLH